MNRRNTPLHALRAFEVAARLGSFSRAADELLVTHSAVSQQIRTLESLLGRRLFERTNRGIELTDAARVIAPVLSQSFDRIERALEGLVETVEDRRLTVTATPSFTAKWLTPHLRHWPHSESGLDIHFKPTLEFLDLASGEADIAIRCGVPPWEGLDAEPVLPIHLTPMCGPSHPLAAGAPVSPADIRRHTLLHADIAGHAIGEEWRLWFDAAGVPDAGAMPGLSFTDPGLALQAAIEGAGIAIGYLELAENDLAAGRLVRLSDRQVRHRSAYYLVYPRNSGQPEKIGQFRKFISRALPRQSEP